jgi:CubicO group peptidase (beta-lactamase class C family)
MIRPTGEYIIPNSCNVQLKYFSDMAVPDLISNMQYLKPSSEPRQRWQYNNQHYILLSHIVTVVTGTPYPEWVKQNIFLPLNMTSTTFNATEAWTSGHSTDAYVRDGRNATKCAEVFNGTHKGIEHVCLGRAVSIGQWGDGNFLFLAGAGGVVSTAHDLVSPPPKVSRDS